MLEFHSCRGLWNLLLYYSTLMNAFLCSEKCVLNICTAWPLCKALCREGTNFAHLVCLRETDCIQSVAPTPDWGWDEDLESGI